MGMEGSVAPKERVNIVYKPATGMDEEKELPLKLVMVGDYTQRPDDTPLEDRKAINIDKDNFNDVMKGMNLETSVSVGNVLAEEKGAQLAVNLKFRGMKDFEPEAVVQQVPELKKLLDLRTALTALKGPLGNVPAFRKKLADVLKDDNAREKLIRELQADTEQGA
jgi:type VI secretion system protein ImpB